MSTECGAAIREKEQKQFYHRKPQQRSRCPGSNQSSKEITELFTKHIKSIAPKSVKVKVTAHHGGEPAVTSTTSLAYKAASNAFAAVWGKSRYRPGRRKYSYRVLFKQELGLDSVLMGFGLNSDAIHSPTNITESKFLLGIETIVAFYKFFGKTR